MEEISKVVSGDPRSTVSVVPCVKPTDRFNSVGVDGGEVGAGLVVVGGGGLVVVGGGGLVVVGGGGLVVAVEGGLGGAEEGGVDAVTLTDATPEVVAGNRGTWRVLARKRILPKEAGRMLARYRPRLLVFTTASVAQLALAGDVS